MLSAIEIARISEKIVKAIIHDMTDRRGLRQAWESIDDYTRQSIVDEWRRLAAGIVTRNLPST
jgi:hypothetical protein